MFLDASMFLSFFFFLSFDSSIGGCENDLSGVLSIL